MGEGRRERKGDGKKTSLKSRPAAYTIMRMVGLVLSAHRVYNTSGCTTVVFFPTESLRPFPSFRTRYPF